jgi:hypothetical protein
MKINTGLFSRREKSMVFVERYIHRGRFVRTATTDNAGVISQLGMRVFEAARLISFTMIIGSLNSGCTSSGGPG